MSFLFANFFNGFSGVLDKIGQGLTDHCAVKFNHVGPGREVLDELDVRLPVFLQHDCSLDQRGQIGFAAVGFGHPGKFGKLIHDAAQVVGLAHDDVGVLFKLFRVGDLIAVFALDALGAQLDGGQRVLDFVGNAARDIAPGGHALGRDKLGDVVEGHDKALYPGIAAPFGHANQQAFQLATPGQANLILNRRAGGFLQAVEKIGKFRNGFGKVSLRRHFRRQIQRPHRGAVHKVDPSHGIQSNHASCHIRQNGIEQPALSFSAIMPFDQCLTLPFQLPCHLVEKPTQHRNLVVALFLDHLHIQIAAADTLGG